MGDLDSGHECLAASPRSGLSAADESEGCEMGRWMWGGREVYRRMIRLRTVTYYWPHLADSRPHASLVSSSNQARGYKLIYPV
ncbi:unnamed protein product [Lasius platythorax]|uniref:Uncharacterized protein n=1 Tax=Lasius platythorax TaxID=488582 RepID=A0AAV2P8U9_9HYME